MTNNTRFLILPWVRVPHLARRLLFGNFAKTGESMNVPSKPQTAGVAGFSVTRMDIALFQEVYDWNICRFRPFSVTGAPSSLPGSGAMGADGLLIEVHPNPAESLSDGQQQVDFAGFRQLMTELPPFLEPAGRRLGS